MGRSHSTLTASQKQKLCSEKKKNPELTSQQLIAFAQTHFAVSPSKTAVQRLLRTRYKFTRVLEKDANKRRSRDGKWPVLESKLSQKLVGVGYFNSSCWCYQLHLVNLRAESHSDESVFGTSEDFCMKRPGLGTNSECKVIILISSFCLQLQFGDSFRITGPRIKQYARELAQELGLERFSASGSWLDGFKKRHGIKSLALQGQGWHGTGVRSFDEPVDLDQARFAASEFAKAEVSTLPLMYFSSCVPFLLIRYFSKQALDVGPWGAACTFLCRGAPLIMTVSVVQGFLPQDVFSVDSYRLYFDCSSSKVLVRPKLTGAASSTRFVTIGLATNSTGTQILRPYVVCKESDQFAFRRPVDDIVRLQCRSAGAELNSEVNSS